MHKLTLTRLLPCFVSLLLYSCSQDEHLFRLVPATESGLDFINRVEEKDSINILTVQYMYHGGGVAIGDFNNDQLNDIFFTGNMVSNRLYLNKGNLTFEDVTPVSGIAAEEKWKSGVAVADVNLDGWLDIYVCATIYEDSTKRANMLFINKGLNKDGIPVFEDRAKQYGLDDHGYSQNAAFFDYDKDGDLDLYVLTNLESDKIPSNYRPRIMDGSALNNDRLYRNNGDGTFTNVTKEAGILIEGYGLGIAITDINQDSWPDIYIGNDYVSNDVLYINNRNGTFTNEIKERIKHQSLFSMGVDVADINNDALPDIITLDMLPENNLRRKTVSGAGATYFNYINNIQYGYEFQYMRNMLQLNNGDGTFSEVGQMAGIHQTDWSWSSLFIDADNDGYRDLFITNGFPKDVTDRDYVIFKREVGAFNHHRSLIDSIPVLKIANYVFQNKGHLAFEDKTVAWGMSHPSFSNGAAFADLDNDGDLDYVVNNINDEAFLYENNLYSEKAKSANHYLRIKLTDPDQKKYLLGSKITIRYGKGNVQFHEHSVNRGYLSTVEDIVHFGLGQYQGVDTLEIEWPDGKQQIYYNIQADQLLTIRYDPDSKVKQRDGARSNPPLAEEISSQLKLVYRHQERDKVDFYKQRTLPHKFSQAGPSIAVGDITGDGLEDFIVGGSASYDATIFTQQKNGIFISSPLKKTIDVKSEDEGLLLFDADQDNDLDLYLVSGSYEYEPGNLYQDRLYVNNGKGKFSLRPNAVPPTMASGSCVRASDFDRDGDLDLFVGGRVVPGSYPLAPESYLLRNDKGIFTDVTSEVCPALQRAGMITDALWTDYNQDNKIDLIVVGEFMPVTIFKNNGKQLEKINNSGVEKLTGWWNSITGADFDKDGDTDYILGNLGCNNYYNISSDHPLRIYAKDFDDNGSVDAILSCYFKSEDGTKREYPVHSWDELFAQSPKFRNQFNSFKHYGHTTMEQLLKPYDLTDALVLTANYSRTSIMENLNGSFRMAALPNEAQTAPVNGVVATDVNNDGNFDVVMIGNDYGNEVFSGRYDAFTGLILLGDGKCNFKPVSSVKSKFKVHGDGKALARISHARYGEILIATQNLDSLKAFALIQNTPDHIFRPMSSDGWAQVEYTDKSKQKIEFYHGSGHLSQSTLSVNIPPQATSVTVYSTNGETRIIDFNQLAIDK